MSTTQGILGEAVFITECIKRNIQVNQLINDIYGYDFIIKNKLRYLSVQVKTTLKHCSRGENIFKIQCRKGANGKAYEGSDFDYLAAYLISVDKWYIIPISELTKTTIRVNPKSDRCRFKSYLNAFHLLGEQ